MYFGPVVISHRLFSPPLAFFFLLFFFFYDLRWSVLILTHQLPGLFFHFLLHGQKVLQISLSVSIFLFIHLYIYLAFFLSLSLSLSIPIDFEIEIHSPAISFAFRGDDVDATFRCIPFANCLSPVCNRQNARWNGILNTEIKIQLHRTINNSSSNSSSNNGDC